MTCRKIIHIDMDAFYASVEMRDNPALRDKPIAVGGSHDRRGVVATANYAARKYGVRSAMATAYALRLCPDLIILPVDMPKYRAIGEGIRKCFYRYTPLVETLSLDEAYLDVTTCNHCNGSATWIANAIRNDIFEEFQLTASAGVAPNKFLAKIASEWHKPNGLFIITPSEIAGFVAKLGVDKIPGVGKVTARKLHDMQINTCADLQNIPQYRLIENFGKSGARLHELSFGIDERSVEPNRIQKSTSVEETFEKDIIDLAIAHQEIDLLFIRLVKRLEKSHGKSIAKHFVKIKFHDFIQTTVECIASDLSCSVFKILFQQGYERKQLPIRLIGIGVHFASENSCAVEQLKLPLDD